MPIKTDLSHLPVADNRRDGEPPDPQPRFVHLLVEAMAKVNAEAGDKPTAHGTRLRHSDAGKCARALGFSAVGVPKSDPMDLPGTWVTSLGTLIHEAWQAALSERFPGAQIEPKLGVDGLDASGHADAIVDHHGTRTLVELKTVGGFSYKMKVGERGAAEGPSFEHKAQAALNGLAVDADEIVIAYMATEAISKPAAAKKGIGELTRFVAEWSYPREEFEPWALAEKARMEGILRLVDEGVLPARKFPVPDLPKGHEVVDPKSGRWEVRRLEEHLGGESVPDAWRVVDTGTWWACGYCAWQTVCVQTPSGRVPIEDIPVDLRRSA